MDCRRHSPWIISSLAWQRIPGSHSGNTNTTRPYRSPAWRTFFRANTLPFSSRVSTRNLEESRLLVCTSPLPCCRALLPPAVCCSRPAVPRATSVPNTKTLADRLGLPTSDSSSVCIDNDLTFLVSGRVSWGFSPSLLCQRRPPTHRQSHCPAVPRLSTYPVMERV